MAIQEKLGLTRDQLGKFLQNQEQIRQFELLFARANEAMGSLAALIAQLAALTVTVTTQGAEITAQGIQINILEEFVDDLSSDLNTLMASIQAVNSDLFAKTRALREEFDQNISNAALTSMIDGLEQRLRKLSECPDACAAGLMGQIAAIQQQANKSTAHINQELGDAALQGQILALSQKSKATQEAAILSPAAEQQLKKPLAYIDQEIGGASLLGQVASVRQLVKKPLAYVDQTIAPESLLSLMLDLAKRVKHLEQESNQNLPAIALFGVS